MLELEKEEKRNNYQISDLDEKIERLDTVVRKKNLGFEGVPEMNPGEKENMQRLVYDVFDQMSINHTVECDTCYRTGPYSRNKPRPIVVTFLKQMERDHVFSKRVNLKTSKDYSRAWVNEDLAPTARRTKTMVRLIAKQAHKKGVACKNNKFSVTVDDIKYNENRLTELPHPLSTECIKQIRIDANTIAYQSEHAPLSSMYPAKVKIGENEYDTSEQAFQHKKATAHNCPLLAERILLCRKTYVIKQMGDDIKTMLIATGTCELVEATPSGKWGAGATLSSNVLKKHNWPGDNKHGKVQTTVRARLIRDL